MQTELLKRLDDASNDVRVASCSALCHAATNMHVGAVTVTTKSAAVHMDDPEASVQRAVFKLLLVLAKAQPAAVAAVLPSACAQHMHQEYVQQVLAACQTV